jgi:hypothetical protein
MNSAGEDLKAAVARKGSFLGTMRAVAWSFLGIRRGKDYEKDVQQLNPLHVIVAGVIGAAIFVGVLIMLVQWIVGSGAAT